MRRRVMMGQTSQSETDPDWEWHTAPGADANTRILMPVKPGQKWEIIFPETSDESIKYLRMSFGDNDLIEILGDRQAHAGQQYVTKTAPEGAVYYFCKYGGRETLLRNAQIRRVL